MMARLTSVLLAVWAGIAAAAIPAADADGKYTISAEGIRAQFIPYGASITNLFINDTHGVERDVVLGYDNATHYSIDKLHPHLGSVPGRYANRIKNSTFDIDGVTYHVLPNENNNQDTLHGGPNGWDHRNFTVVAYTNDSITFSLVDADGNQGFPGEVVSYITYTLTPYEWHLKMVALATTKKTPIMLSSHTYWNLDGFASPSTPLALNHTLHLPLSGQTIATDPLLIPTGPLLPAPPHSIDDFWTAPKPLGANLSAPALRGHCGTNCTGYDTCFVLDRPGGAEADWQAAPVARLQSPWSGIGVEIFTDQAAVQVYTCNGMNGTFPLKRTQGVLEGEGNATVGAAAQRPRVVEKYGCVVLEVEDWIDGVNHPEWRRGERQVFGPQTGPYVLRARYRFDVA